MPAGQKRDLTQDEKELAIEMAYAGEPIHKIEQALGISPQSFTRNKREDTAFSQDFNLARHEGLEHIADELRTMAEDIEDVNRARLHSDNTKWLLSKRKPEVYGDRVDVNLNQTVDIGGAIREARARVVGEVVSTKLVEQPNKLNPEDDDIFS